MRHVEWTGSDRRAQTQTSLFTPEDSGEKDVSSVLWFGARPGELEAPREIDASAPPDQIGDHYRVLRTMASGAMGLVLLAKDQRTGGLVALKRPRTQAPSPADLRRVRREADTIRSLDHPAIVRAHDTRDDDDGTPYFTMDYLRGRSLRAVIHDLREGALRRSFAWRARVVLQIARGLSHAHERGVVHRDVKPENIMVTDEGEAVLIDWGLAKRGGRDPTSGRLARCRLRGNASSSEAHTVAGTPIYMAPEALRGAVSPQTDVFSLAATLYELLTLQHYLPEPSSEYGVLAQQVSEAQPIPAEQVEVAGQPPVPSDLARVCAQGLAKAPRVRYSSAAELAEDLERCLGHVKSYSVKT